MKKPLWLIAILAPLVLCAFQPVMAQHVTFTVIPRPLLSSRIFFVSDLDLLRQGYGQELFRLSFVQNDTFVPRTLKTIMTNGAGDVLATGKLDLSIFHSGNTWTVTNLNISGGHGNWETADNLSSRYQSQVLRTGMVPADIYTYEFQVYNGTYNGTTLGTLLADESSSFTVLGNGYLTLRFPDNDPAGNNPVMSTLPFFAWNSSEQNFSIKIAEIRSGETPEGALNSRENCEVNNITSTSFQYPSAGVVPLDPGKFYAWQVTTHLSTSHGTMDITSEIFTFRIAPVMTPESTQLLAALQQLLSTGNGPQLLAMIQRGNLTGEIYLGDQLITVQQLYAMLPEFNAQHFTIHTMHVE